MMKIDLNSRNFEKLQRFSAFSRKKQSEKIRANFVKTSENRHEIQQNCKLFCIPFFENAKHFEGNLLNFCDRRGGKGCKSDRSRHELSNEYLFAKIGVDVAEPLKAHI